MQTSMYMGGESVNACVRRKYMAIENVCTFVQKSSVWTKVTSSFRLTKCIPGFVSSC